MKTIGTLFAGLVLFSTAIHAQNERKITIEKTTVEPNGAVRSEVIVKTGEDARQFDLEQYLETHEDERLIIIVERSNGKRQYIRTAPEEELSDADYLDAESAAEMAMAEALRAAEAPVSRGFLGVSPSGDDDPSKPGVAVKVIANSGAERAGLHNEDIVLKLNDQPVSAWADIESIMSGTYPGQQINIRYRPKNESKERTVKATLTAKSNNQPDWQVIVEDENLGWGEVQIDERTKEACLGVYSGEAEQGAEINEFTSTSAAQSAGMQVGDIITGVNGVVVKNHDELWNQIARFKAGETVNIEYLRAGKTQVVNVTLNPCDTQKQIILRSQDDSGEGELSRMYIWDWTKDNRDLLRNSQVIAIPRAGEGDVPVRTDLDTPIPADRQLKVRNFESTPASNGNPVTLAFSAAPVATMVTMFDAAGRQIFREELNSFSGTYNRQFDLSAHANTTITLHVQQGELVFMQKMVVGI